MIDCLSSSRISQRGLRLLAAVVPLFLSGPGLRAAGVAASRPGQPITASSWGDCVETNFPFFSSVLDARKLGDGLPADNLTPRGIVLNLGHGCWAGFDTDLLRVAAIWTGEGVTPVSMSHISYHSTAAKATEGQKDLPRPAGAVWLANGIYPGWQTGEQVSLVDPRDPGPDPQEVGRGPLPKAVGQFQAVRLTPAGLCLEYEVAGALVKEWVEARLDGGRSVVQRRFRLERVPQPLWLVLGRGPRSIAERLHVDIAAAQTGGRAGAALQTRPDGLLLVRVEPSQRPVEFRVAIGASAEVKAGKSASANIDVTPAQRWQAAVTTHATLATAPEAYVVDNIPVPTENPWRRNVRLADLAFFRDGRAAAVTFDGDVWMISGLGGDLSKVVWRRFSSGLHEPLGLAIRGEEVFVFDRNGIWRLRDTDGNGEADAHELFSNAFTQTAETREYAHSIRTAPDGSFVIAKGGIQWASLGRDNGSVLRISPDGKTTTVLGHGLRSPIASVHPKSGLVLASDQQGNYVPTTPLQVIRDHQFYGFLSNLLPKEQYPAPIAEPLTWVPYPVNASAGGQAWLVDARMGPLNDALVYVGYYRPEVFLVLMNHRMPRLQAAVLSVTRKLEFSPLACALNPVDGQLYIIGFQIFSTTANQIIGLARLRYTGAPSTLPREIVPMDKGVLLRFDAALDAKRAASAGNFSAERWNYSRTFNYGSPHFKPDGSKGQEAMTPSSAYVSRDGKSVFVGIRDMKPVMQMRVGWTLAVKDGAAFEQSAYFTPYELDRFDPSAEGFEPLTVDLTPKAAATAAETPVTPEEGRRLAELLGCAACHSNDGITLGKVGPTWKGLFGREREFANSGKLVADEAYIRESIREPGAKVVRGFEKSDTAMPSYEGLISEEQIQALILYIKTLR